MITDYLRNFETAKLILPVESEFNLTQNHNNLEDTVDESLEVPDVETRF